MLALVVVQSLANSCGRGRGAWWERGCGRGSLSGGGRGLEGVWLGCAWESREEGDWELVPVTTYTQTRSHLIMGGGLLGLSCRSVFSCGAAGLSGLVAPLGLDL